MSMTTDLAAVQRRIDAIAGAPVRIASGDEMRRIRTPREHGNFERLVAREARAAHVDPALVAAVAQTESGFDPSATSGAGAQGLMQLMPDTARSLGVTDPYDPVANVRGGATYLRELLDRFGGDVRLAVAAYNAGPGAVEKYGRVPPYAETQQYVARVLDAFRARIAR